MLDSNDLNIKVPENKTKNLVVFWIRMVSWVLTQTVAPITVFGIKFGLFKSASVTTVTDELGNVVETSTSISLNGWGIVSVFIVGWTVYQIINSVFDAMEAGYSMSKQVIEGIEGIVKVSQGENHTIFLSSDKKAYAMGTNINGQCGTGTKVNCITPTMIRNNVGTEALSNSLNGLINSVPGLAVRLISIG